MRYLMALAVGATMLSLAPRASGQAAEITEPVWITRAPTAQLPERISGGFPLNVALRCVARSGALVDCAATRPTPDAFLANAVDAASRARIAAADGQGASTEGRPIVVQIGFPIPVAIDPPAAPPAAAVLTNVVWLEQPDAQDFARLYPDRAQQENVSGRATLECIVAGDGRLSCTITSEDPSGYGFGDATLSISREFRLAPETSDGQPTSGGRIRRTIRWVIG